jgi:hypothetical protein
VSASSMVDDIIPGVIIPEMPKLRSTTLTRVDLYLEPPPLPPLSSRLLIARCGTLEKSL